MEYATYDPTEMMGIGGFVGETRQGPDGNLYQWNEGVDGLGNPVGIWKLAKRGARAYGRGLKRVARHALSPTNLIPGVGPLRAATGVLKKTGILGDGEEVMDADMMGIGSYVGEMRQGPDGHLYEWNEGVDGLGNPVGFWKKAVRGALRVAKKGLPLTRFIPGIGPVIQQVRQGVRKFCRVVPKLQPLAAQVPDARGPLKVASGVCRVLKKTGLAGVEGPIMEADDGSHYEMVEGIGEFGEPRTRMRRVRLIVPARQQDA